MRALMALVEGDHHLVSNAELSAVAPEVLVAARRAGVFAMKSSPLFFDR